MSCCLLLCGFSLVLMWCKAKCCPTIGGLPSCAGVMSGSLCGGVVFRGAVSMVSTSIWIPGTKTTRRLSLRALFFVLFFPVFWLRWFFLAFAPHRFGTCSTLEFGSLISSMVSAAVWSLDLSCICLRLIYGWIKG